MPIITGSGKRIGKVAREITNEGYRSTKGIYYYGTKMHLLGFWRIGKLPYPEQILFTSASESDTIVYKYAWSKLENRVFFGDKIYSAANILKDRVLPLYEQSNIPLLRILTDRGTEYCGAREHHKYQLYLAIEDIDHTRTKAKHPQTKGNCERLHRTMQNKFYSVAFRKKHYNSVDELQADVDLWLDYYNKERPHSGKYCFGKTPWQTWNESLNLTKNKMLDTLYQKDVSSLLTGEAETGSGRNQPARSILSGWDGQGAPKAPNSRRSFQEYMSRKTHCPDRAKISLLSDDV